jgi:hypothetical protein
MKKKKKKKKKPPQTPVKALGSKGHRSFEVQQGALFKIEDEKKRLVANFHLLINSQLAIVDEGKVKEKRYELILKHGTASHTFILSQSEFFSPRLRKKVAEVAGPSAILYGSLKDLQVATQELSGPNIPIKEVLASPGFDSREQFHSAGFLVARRGISKDPAPPLDLDRGNFARKLGLLPPEKSKMPALGRHIASDFLNLKSHDVTYPLIGHIALAPFTSVFPEVTGKEKVAMHLQGSAGGGKTFLGQLAMSFFGKFEGMLPSWSSTANAIEAEGYPFRDSLFLVDDYKAAFVPQETIVRIFQGYADNHGRLRLKSNGQTQDHRYIRGLLLSTGEDFVSDVQSVTGRTICLQVEPGKNVRAGKKCWESRQRYPMFLPGLVQMVISRPNWKEWLKGFVDQKLTEFTEETRGLSNGLRIASNWALNALGFHMFLGYLTKLDAIDRNSKRRMEREYGSIVKAHLLEQTNRLQNESPAEVFFRIIGQKASTGAVTVTGLNGVEAKPKGRTIGFAKDQSVMIFPDVAMEVLASHFRTVGQRMPFTKSSLRDALAQDNLIARPKEGRWARQVRVEEGRRVQVWDFDLENFKSKIKVV